MDISSSPHVTATFLGATSLLFSDGQTHLLTDGFFSRPSLRQVAFTRLRPDLPVIQRGLERAGIRTLDALLVGHTHYDHALDAPTVARLTGAPLVGSLSAANLARGAQLPEAQIVLAQAARPLNFGDFRVTFLPSAHIRPNLAAGRIPAPLHLPAHAGAFKDGGVFTLLLEHPAGSLLVQESAGFLPGELAGHQVEVAFLSLGSLGRRSPAYRRAYFEQLAGAARRIYPIHHDDFTRPLGETLRQMPRWMDDTPAALASLHEWAAGRGLRIAELPPWQPVPILPLSPDPSLA